MQTLQEKYKPKKKKKSRVLEINHYNLVTNNFVHSIHEFNYVMKIYGQHELIT